MPDTQITDEMVELGAQAAYEHEPIVFQCADIPWQAVSEGTRDRYRHKIRLALTAALSGHVVVPREPTPAMLRAGHAGEYDSPVGRYSNIYRAMIQAATPAPVERG